MKRRTTKKLDFGLTNMIVRAMYYRYRTQMRQKRCGKEDGKFPVYGSCVAGVYGFQHSRNENPEKNPHKC